MPVGLLLTMTHTCQLQQPDEISVSYNFRKAHGLRLNCCWGVYLWEFFLQASAEQEIESDPKVFCNYQTFSYPSCTPALWLGLREDLNPLKLKGFVYPCGKKLPSATGTALLTPASTPESVTYSSQARPQSSREMMSETWSLSMGSQCREQEWVWHAHGCLSC